MCLFVSTTLCFAVGVAILLVSAMVVPMSHLDTGTSTARSEGATTAHETETPEVGDLERC
jgi:hypothetical protein